MPCNPNGREMNKFFDSFSIAPNLMWIAIAAVGMLLVGTIVRLAAIRGVASDVAAHKIGSLKTWWVVTLIVLSATLMGRTATIVLFTFISLLSMREFILLSKRENLNMSLLVCAYVMIPGHYLCIWLGAGQTVFLPIVGLIVASVVMVIGSHTIGFLRQIACVYFGLLLTTYCLGHAALLFTLPPETNELAGAAGWFLYLIALTEINDIFQALRRS